MKRFAIFMISILLFSMLIGCGLMAEQRLITSKPAGDSPVEKSAPPVVEQEPVKKVESSYEAVPAPEVPEPEPISDFDMEEDRAISAAKDWLDSLDGFANQKGRDVQIKNTVKTECEGCWLVELTFVRTDQYYPDKDEKVRVNLKLKDWKMDSYTFE